MQALDLIGQLLGEITGLLSCVGQLALCITLSGAIRWILSIKGVVERVVELNVLR